MKEISKNNFNILFEKLVNETMFDSNPHGCKKYSEYQELLNMGRIIVPWLIERLDSYGCFISMTLLSTLTKQNPIQKRHCGKVDKMIQDWKTWWIKSNGVF